MVWVSLSGDAGLYHGGGRFGRRLLKIVLRSNWPSWGLETISRYPKGFRLAANGGGICYRHSGIGFGMVAGGGPVGQYLRHSSFRRSSTNQLGWGNSPDQRRQLERTSCRCAEDWRMATGGGRHEEGRYMGTGRTDCLDGGFYVSLLYPFSPDSHSPGPPSEPPTRPRRTVGPESLSNTHTNITHTHITRLSATTLYRCFPSLFLLLSRPRFFVFVFSHITPLFFFSRSCYLA